MNQPDQYRRAFGDLSPSLRAKMTAMGIFGPALDDHHEPASMSGDGIGYAPQMPAEIDDAEGDLLHDLVPGLNALQVEQIIAWSNGKTSATAKTMASELLYAVLLYLMRPKVDFRTATVALIYAAGIDGLMAGNVPQNQMAKSLGISRARLNYYVGEWRDTLKYTVLKFCRSDATRAIYAARQTKIHAEKNPKSQCKTH